MSLLEAVNLRSEENEQLLTTTIYKRSAFDRRSGFDRRSSYSVKYLLAGKRDRRKNSTDRRRTGEKRAGWLRVTKWSSICGLFVVKVKY